MNQPSTFKRQQLFNITLVAKDFSFYFLLFQWLSNLLFNLRVCHSFQFLLPYLTQVLPFYCPKPWFECQKDFFLLVWLTKHWRSTNPGLAMWSLQTFRARLPNFCNDFLLKSRLTPLICVWFLYFPKWNERLWFLFQKLPLSSLDARTWQSRSSFFVLPKAAFWNEEGRPLPEPRICCCCLSGRETLWVCSWPVCFYSFSFCLSISIHAAEFVAQLEKLRAFVHALSSQSLNRSSFSPPPIPRPAITPSSQPRSGISEETKQRYLAERCCFNCKRQGRSINSCRLPRSDKFPMLESGASKFFWFFFFETTKF